MIAEIHGKISRTGSNLSDRLEDKLTGDVFGTLRYISFNKVMKKILMKSDANDLIKDVDLDYWSDKISFWPYDKSAELDFVIDLDEVCIGVEVKYLSGLSSDDGKVDDVTSNHQLKRESEVLKKISNFDEKKAVLIFIAQENICESICKDAIERNIIDKEVDLIHLSWEKVTGVIRKLKDDNELNDYEKVIIEDIYNLLRRKGFERFKNFKVDEFTIEDSYFEFNLENILIEFKNIDTEVKEEIYYEF